MEQIIAILQITPKHAINIKEIIFNVISHHCTLSLWIAQQKTDLFDIDSLLDNMVDINDNHLKYSTRLNNAEKGILAHMNTHFKLFTTESVSPNTTAKSFFNDHPQYDLVYKKNLQK